MTDLARTLLSSMLTVTVGCSAVILLLLALRRPLGRLRASTRHLLWLLVLVRLALPLALPLSPLGITLTLPTKPIAEAAVTTPETTRAPEQAISPEIIPVPETPPAPDSFAPTVPIESIAPTAPIESNEPIESAAPVKPIEPILSPPSTTAAPIAALPVPEQEETGTSAPLVQSPLPVAPIEADAPVTARPVTAPPQTAAEAPIPTPSSALRPAALLPLVLILWLGVALLLLVLRLGRALSLNRALAREGRPLRNPTLRALYINLCIDADLDRAPDIRVSPTISSPLVYGMLRPTVLLPETLVDPDAFCGVVRHELAHIRRRDILLKLPVLIALSLHWFNPLVYLAVRRYEAEAELACDAVVLADCDDDARRSYGLVLLDILRRDHDRRHTELTTHFRPNRRTVRHRFENILDATPKSAGRGIVALMLVICLTMGSLVACRVGGPIEDDTSDTDTATTTDNSTPDTGTPSTDAATTPAETTAAPTTTPAVPDTPVDTRERIDLDFTPVEPSPAEIRPLSAAGQTATYATSSVIRVTDATGSLVNTWTLRHGWQNGLAIAEDQHFNLALLWSANEMSDFHTVELPLGVKLLTKQLIDLGQGEQLVCVAYETGGELGADGFLRRDGKLYRAFRTVYSVEVADLDGNRIEEYIGGLSYTNRTGLWMVQEGKLCFADPAEAIRMTVKDAQIIESRFDESKNDFVVTLRSAAGSTETVRASYYDGALMVDSREAAQARPALTGDVYLRGICSENGEYDLILHATPNRVYYAYYYDGTRLMYETGLTSVYESGIYFYQHYGISVGMHHFGLTADNCFSGDTWGNFRYGDRAVAISEEEYKALLSDYEARLAAQAEDQSPAGTILLSTPLRNGDHDPDILRLRVVNKYKNANSIQIGLSYILERRNDENMSWHRVIETPKPTFSATRFTIECMQEAVIDLDMTAYTPLLADDGFYRVLVPVYIHDEEVTLSCYFGGGMIGPRFTVDDWSCLYYGGTNRAFTLDAVTRSVRLDGVSGITRLEDLHEVNPWEFVRLEPDAITIFYPRGEFTSAYYMQDAALTVTLDGRPIAVTGHTMRPAEELVAVRYQLGETIKNEGGRVLSFTRERVSDPNDTLHRWRMYWSPEVFDLHVFSHVCVDCGAVAKQYSIEKCTRRSDEYCYHCDFPQAE